MYSVASKLLSNSIGLQCCSRSFWSITELRSVHQSSCRFDNSDDSADERPHMHQLEHVQKRIEHCTSLMFRQSLDYTFYRKDVVLDNQILNIKRVGLVSYMNHISGIAFIINFTLPYADLEALNIIPLLDDGTVRLRWRIRYQNWWTALSWRNITNKLDFEKSLNWYDGYSIFVVDGNGLVSKVTFQKSMPNNDKTLTPRKIAQKIVQKTQPAATNSFPTILIG